MRRSVLFTACVGLVAPAGLFAPSVASAIVIADNGPQADNPAANKVRPASDPGWDNVGWRGFGTAPADGATAIYLGNRYVLTAAHVGAGPVTFFTDDPAGGTTFGVDGSFAPIRPANPAVPGGLSDLLLYRIASDPGIAPLNIAAASPVVGAQVRVIGTGVTRGSATQTGATIPPNGGYFWSGVRDKVFGDDTVSFPTAPGADGSGGQSLEFRTTFDQAPGQPMAADKDSGSAAFVFNTALNRWELAGVTTAIFTFQGQPGGTAGFGNQTAYIDVSVYRSQFPANVPEPTAALLAPAAAVGLLARRRRHVRSICWEGGLLS